MPVARASPVVVVGRMRAEEELWHPPGGGGTDGTRTGTSCVMDLLRVRSIGQTPTLEVLGGTSLSWEPGAPLGEPLERLGWRSREPVVLAVPTPGMAGGAIPLRAPISTEPADTSGFAVSAATDVRERIREARWRGREQFLEAARRFFDCSLERVVVLTEDVRVSTEEEAAGSVHATLQCLLKHLDGAPDVSVVPLDLPDTQFVLLPLMIGELFRELPDSVGLVIMEEDRMTYVLWREGQMKFLRSFPLGAGLLVTHLMRALECSPRDASTLLDQANDGTLSPDARRLLKKTLRPIFPFFSGVWRMVEGELKDHPRPTRCAIAGYWPTLLLQVVSRTAFQSRCLHPAATMHVLPHAPREVRGDVGLRVFQAEPSRGLLDLLASAVLTHRVLSPDTQFPISGHRQRELAAVPVARHPRRLLFQP